MSAKVTKNNQKIFSKENHIEDFINELAEVLSSITNTPQQPKETGEQTPLPSEKKQGGKHV